MICISKLYHRPAHAVRVFERVVEEQAVLGHSLHSLSHGYSLGTGVMLHFEFVDSPPTADCRLTYALGRRREASQVAAEGWTIDSVIPMTAAWIPIGYFYLSKKAHEAS